MCTLLNTYKNAFLALESRTVWYLLFSGCTAFWLLLAVAVLQLR